MFCPVGMAIKLISKLPLFDLGNERSHENKMLVGFVHAGPASELNSINGNLIKAFPSVHGGIVNAQVNY